MTTASLHKYLYANGNPVTYSDTSGNMPSMIEGIISEGIQGVLVARGEILYHGVVSGLINSLVTAALGGSFKETMASFAKGFIFSTTLTIFAITHDIPELAIMSGVMVILSIAEWCSAYGRYVTLDVWGNKGNARIEIDPSRSKGGSGSRNRIGNPVNPMDKTYEMALNPELPSAGKTRAVNPNVIELGPSAFVSEEELANTIAHELNYARSFLKGGDAPKWGKGGAYPAGNALAEYIRGER